MHALQQHVSRLNLTDNLICSEHHPWNSSAALLNTEMCNLQCDWCILVIPVGEIAPSIGNLHHFIIYNVFILYATMVITLMSTH